jgi:hypothetical protein
VSRHRRYRAARRQLSPGDVRWDCSGVLRYGGCAAIAGELAAKQGAPLVANDHSGNYTFFQLETIVRIYQCEECTDYPDTLQTAARESARSLLRIA